MASVNESLEDQTVAHSVFVHRYTTGVVRKIIKALDAVDADIVARIAQADLPDVEGSRREARLRTMLEKVRRLNQAAYAAVDRAMQGEMLDLTTYEAEFWRGRMNAAVGVDLFDVLPPAEQLRAIVLESPVAGKPLKNWWNDEERDRFDRISREMRMGLIEGETTDQMIRRIRGTRAANYSDGVLQTNRNRAETIVRTGVTHVQARAAEALFSEHTDIIEKVRWVSTLDGRTSDVCIARDGQLYELNAGPRPPAHPKCRSRISPVLRSWDDLAQDGRLRRGRGSTNIDTLFRQRLKAKGLSDDQIAKVQRDARASMDGQIPATQTYGDWLRRKPASFQDEVLGEVKGKLFRDGGLRVDRFVDYTGRSYSIRELRQREPEAFAKAFPGGLDL
jgi:SPP1 gp7 family putative phage head morphogenesis protein